MNEKSRSTDTSLSDEKILSRMEVDRQREVDRD